jgi:hypothetical protein
MRRRSAGAGKKKGREGKGADRWDPPVGAAEKEKGKGRVVGRRGKLGWAAWAERGVWGAFVFFLFLFQTLFSNPFSTQIQIKLLQTFLKNFIGFLETTQATKNHARQLMMHIHLLSLGLLNYL